MSRILILCVILTIPSTNDAVLLPVDQGVHRDHYRMPNILKTKSPDQDSWVLFDRLGPMDSCRRLVADRMIEKLSHSMDPDDMDAESKKQWYDALALSLTNCHLDSHGRDAQYTGTFEMTEAHFSLYTQFLLAVEHISSEMEHERWQRSVENLVTELHSGSTRAKESIRSILSMATRGIDNQEQLLRAQKRLRSSMRLSIKHQKRFWDNFTKHTTERFGQVHSTVTETGTLASETLYQIRNQQVVLEEISHNSDNLKNSMGQHVEMLNSAKHQLVNTFEEWKPLIESIHYATTQQNTLYETTLVLLFYFAWLVYSLAQKTYRKENISVCALAVICETILEPSMTWSHRRCFFLLSFLSQVLTSFLPKQMPAGRIQDDLLTSALIDQIVRLRLANVNVTLNAKLQRNLQAPPPGYYINPDFSYDDSDSDSEYLVPHRRLFPYSLEL
mmetsp:Transcript_8980/g.16859  ORF Transcript_8980/g.16859 Transcript_8980/m.16859 type:complete len:445 (-) Transcript_8980:895-2229(-)